MLDKNGDEINKGDILKEDSLYYCFVILGAMLAAVLGFCYLFG